MLKITKKSEPIHVKNIVLVLYALPGLRKTSMSFTASRPILLDTDGASYRAINRGDVVQVRSWADVESVAAEDVGDYDTIVLDTVGRALDFLSADIIANNPKYGYLGNLSLQGFGVLKGRFLGWKNGLLTLGKDLVLVVHMEEKSEGDITKERFDIQGGSRSEVYKSADAIAKIFIENNKYKLDFSPREGSLGKNPAQFPILDVPDFLKQPDFLAGVIQKVKDSINKLSDEQRAEAQAVEAWRARAAKASTAAEFNAMMPDVRTASPTAKAIVGELAKKHGLKFDKEAYAYYAIPAAPAIPKDIPDDPGAPEPLDEPAFKNPVTAALQASVAAEAPQASSEVQEAPIEVPKRGRGRPKGAVNKSKAVEPIAPAPQPMPVTQSFLLAGKLVEVRDLSTTDGRKFQSLRFANPDSKEFTIYNTKHEWFDVLRFAQGKMATVSVHDVPKSDKVLLDDVDEIDGEKYEAGKPVPKELADLFA